MVMSIIAICNLALAHLGVEPILTLSEDTDRARKCKSVADHTLKWLLRKHDWNFASAEAALGVTGDPPTDDSPYQYLIPSESLHIREVCSDRAGTVPIAYWIDGDYLYTYDADETVYIRYTSYTSSLPASPAFETCAALYIAGAVGRGITGNAALAQEKMQEAEKAFQAATGMDNRESKLKVRCVSSWVNAR